MKNYAIGADIGGSHISCAVIDLNRKIILRETYATQPVDNKDQADHILNNWVIALKKSLSFIDINELAGIGFAMPGPFDYEKGIALFSHENDKYESLYGVDVAMHIKDVFSLKSASDVRFMNDASSFAVGEAWFGKSANVDKSVCITLGTGFGSAFIERGLPVVERDDVPKMGCVWHLPFNHSIADDSFSTRWFIKSFAEKTGWQMAGVKEIANRVKSDSRALEVFEEFGTNLGEFLGPWLAKFNADALVIGGNIAAAYPLFGNNLVSSLKRQSILTNIYISELKEDAAIIGSARLFETDFWNEIKPLLSKM
jgi:glucokinase